MSLRHLFENNIESGIDKVSKNATEVVKQIPTAVDDISSKFTSIYNTGKEYVSSGADAIKQFGVDFGNKAASYVDSIKPFGDNAQAIAADQIANGKEAVDTVQQNISGIASDFNNMSIPDFAQAHAGLTAGVGIPTAVLAGIGLNALRRRMKNR